MFSSAPGVCPKCDGNIAVPNGVRCGHCNEVIGLTYRAKPQPVRLSAEMLGEEAVLRMLKFARMTIQSRRNIEDIEATITYRGTPRGKEHAKCVALCDDSLATIDRLLNQREGE